MHLHNNRYLTIALASFALGVTTPSLAKSLSISGELETRLPETQVNLLAGDVIAHVGRFDAEANFVNYGCVVTTDPSEAMSAPQTDSQTCLFTFDNYDSGLIPQGEHLRGYLSQDGDHDIDYSFTYFSGSNKEPVTFGSGTKSFSALAPQVPTFVSARSMWGTQWQSGLTPTNHNRNDRLEQVHVVVEPRNYDQKITLPDHSASCSILAGSIDCYLSTGSVGLGLDSDQLQGVDRDTFVINSLNDYFQEGVDGNITTELVKSWDYRPPFIGNAMYKAVSKPDEVSRTLIANGFSVDVENNRYMIETYSPHVNKPGTWWEPQNAVLTLTPNAVVDNTSALIVDGHTLFANPSVNQLEKTQLTSIGKQRYGNSFVFEFDLSSIPDGLYLPEIDIKDQYNNASDTVTKDEAALARTTPDIKLFHDYKPVVAGDGVYFFERLLVAGHNGYADQVSVTEAYVEGEPLTLVGGNDSYKTVDATGILLDPNEIKTITVKAEDLAGNTVTKDFPIHYMPISFDMPRLPESAYEDIQRLDFSLSQISGTNCELYPDAQVAIERATNGRTTCSFEWANLPDGLETDLNNTLPRVTGVLSDVGEQFVSYKVWAYDEYGHKNIASNSNISITGLEIPLPTIEIQSYGIPKANDVFPVETTGGRFASARFTTVSGEVDTYYADENDKSKLERKVQQRVGLEKLTYALKMDSLKGDLWSSRLYELGASFTLSPDVKTTETIETVFVPSRSIRVAMTVDEKFGITNVKMPSTLSVGLYSKETRSLVYDPETMGDWTVKVVTEGAEGQIIDMSPALPLDDEGQATAEIDMSVVNKMGANIYALATLDSQLDGYEHEIVSSKRYYRIMKGEQIEGGISARQITAIPPFRTMFRYSTESKADQNSLGSVQWEVSDDNGVSWYAKTPASNLKSFNFDVNEVGEWLVRAKTVNRYTSVESITDHVKVTGYYRPKIKIQGKNLLLTGQNSDYTIVDEYGETDSNDLYEWSVDDGETWQAGTDTFSITNAQESLTLKARMKYFETGIEADAKGWGAAKFPVNVKAPKAPRLSALIPRLVEVGHMYELTARSRAPFSGMSTPIIHEWTLPDGSTNNNEVLPYVPQESDIVDGKVKMTLNAWIEGYKDTTLATKNITIKGWEYNFPEFSVALKEGVRYAPAKTTAYIQKPRMYAPGVTFSYDWQYDEQAVQIVYNAQERVQFLITEPGTHQIDLVASDNRGNSQTITSFVEALPLEDIVVTPKIVRSNELQRAPLDVSIRIGAKLSHPNDMIVSYDWFLNGDKLHEDMKGRYKHMVEGLQAGNHEVKLVITTKYGQISENNFDFEVVPNNKPTCTLVQLDYSNYTRIKSSCIDSDGQMSMYQWFVNGEEKNIWSHSISLTKQSEDVEVKMRGYDDSGDYTENTITILKSVD